MWWLHGSKIKRWRNPMINTVTRVSLSCIRRVLLINVGNHMHPVKTKKEKDAGIQWKSPSHNYPQIALSLQIAHDSTGYTLDIYRGVTYNVQMRSYYWWGVPHLLLQLQNWNHTCVELRNCFMSYMAICK